MSLKSSYVRTMRGLRNVADHLGVREPLPGERGARAHLRSLMDIHDADALIHWDVPWWTYRAVDAVDGYLRTRDTARVFEYGSGASTIWLSRRATEVHTVEHDLAWATSLAPRFEEFDNVTLHVVQPRKSANPRARSGRKGFDGLDFEAYVATLERVGGEFDLIVIDGRARMACLELAVSQLAIGGWIVLDNSRRRRYRHALTTCRMNIERMGGAAPGLPYPDETAVLRASVNSIAAIPAPREVGGEVSATRASRLV